ncbi:basic proline-rich protein-like, partial [Trachypithecus francoisi]|uniref:basic proline-rich protein-like n=1 Tax=Trachypithecus francoisi TaxID=54180 RepID=UPI00141B7FF4
MAWHLRPAAKRLVLARPSRAHLVERRPPTHTHTHCSRKGGQETGAASARASARSPLPPTCAPPSGDARRGELAGKRAGSPRLALSVGEGGQEASGTCHSRRERGDFRVAPAFLHLPPADQSVSSPLPLPRYEALCRGLAPYRQRWGARHHLPPPGRAGALGPARAGPPEWVGWGPLRPPGAAQQAADRERGQFCCGSPAARPAETLAPPLPGPPPLHRLRLLPHTPPGRPGPKPSRRSSPFSSHSLSGRGPPAARRPAPFGASPASWALLSHTRLLAGPSPPLRPSSSWSLLRLPSGRIDVPSA